MVPEESVIKDFFLKQHALVPLELVLSECAIHLHCHFCLRSTIPGETVCFVEDTDEGDKYLHPVAGFEFCKN